MKAGAGKSEIILTDEYLEIENFTVIHKALNARAVVMESENVFVCLSLEMTSLPEEEVKMMRQGIAERFRLEETQIWVCVTHTFSAPHLLPDGILKDEEKIKQKEIYRKALHKAAMEAVELAFASMQPVRAGFGTGLCEVNRNRDVELQDGWWVGEGGLGLTDHTVSVLSLNRADETPLAILFHYGVQSSVLDGSELNAGGKAVTPDLAGTASVYIEKMYKEDNTIGLFLIGAAGDQCPIEKTVHEVFVQGERVRRDRQEEGFGICESLGEKLGKTVCDIMQKMTYTNVADKIKYGKVNFHVPGKEMERELKKLHPVKQMEYIPSTDKEIEVEAVCIGELALVGVKPELNCCSGIAISEYSPFQNTLVCTMVNGASKYMADRNSYNRYTYEAINSPFGKGAAELLIRQSVALLEDMTNSLS
ncbi:MAG: hypothetical protein NC416_14210 [Eubacterium sp.]|nr:hypothetical protein [Eubacterium sp.]